MGDYGIMVSESGDNVLTQIADTAQFSSKYSTLKLYRWGNAQFTTDGSGNGSVDVPHVLSYAPAFFVFNKVTYQDTFFSATSYPDCYFPIGIWSEFDVYSTSTDLHIGTDFALTPNTTYYFRYYLLVDLAGDFSGSSGINLSGDRGFKVSKKDIDVITAKEYQLAYSSKYKALQYYTESFKSETLTLPGYTASVIDTDPKAGTYVDFAHGLGYPPFFLVYYHSSLMTDPDEYREIPFMTLSAGNTTKSEYYSWCDATRVRVIFKNQADYPLNNTAEAETITIKLYVFTEDLNGE